MKRNAIQRTNRIQRTPAAAPGRAALSWAALLATGLTLPVLAGLKYEPDAYVQDGLVLMYDGIRNAGLNAARDPSATVWKDLSGNSNDAKFLAYKSAASTASGWTDNGYFLDDWQYAQTSANVENDECMTIEVFGDFRQSQPTQYPNWISLVTSGNEDCGIRMNGGALKWKVDSYGFSNGNRPAISNWDKLGFSAVIDSTSATLYASGTEKSGTTTGTRTSDKAFPSAKWNIGCNYKASDHTSRGTNYCIRIYSKALTEEQVKANWQLDQYRFVTGIPETNCVIATSVAGAYGNEIPGAYAVDSDGYTFKAATQVTAGGVDYTLSGYTLETWNSTTEEWESDGEGTHEYSGGVAISGTDCKRITWQWSGAPTFAETPSIVAAADSLSVSYTLGAVAATKIEIFAGGSGVSPLGSVEGTLAANSTGTIKLDSFEGTQTLTAKVTGAAGSYSVELGNAYNGALTVEATDADEGSLTSAVVTISRTGDTTLPLTVNFHTTDGTAAAGTDFKALTTTTATIAAGATSTTLKIKPIFNSAKTTDTSFAFALTSGNYWTGSSAAVTIKNAASISCILLRDTFTTATGGYSGSANIADGTVLKNQSIAVDGEVFGYADASAWAGGEGNGRFAVLNNTTLAFPDKYPVSASTGCLGLRKYRGDCNTNYRAIDRDRLTAPAEKLYFAFLLKVTETGTSALTVSPKENQNYAFGAGIVNSYYVYFQKNSGVYGLWYNSWYNSTGFLFEFAQDADDASRFALYLVTEPDSQTFDPGKHNYLKLVEDAKAGTTYFCIAELTRNGTGTVNDTFTIRAATKTLALDGSKEYFDKSSFVQATDGEGNAVALPLLLDTTASGNTKQPYLSLLSCTGSTASTYSDSDAYLDEFVIATDLELIVGSLKKAGMMIIIK